MRALLIWLFIAVPALAAAAAPIPPIPPSLAVPGQAILLLTAKASGVQIYLCDPVTNAWGLKAPEATLMDQQGQVIGKHFAGPSWSLDDGSLVKGEVTAKDPGPSADAISWLLLKVISNSGKGKLAAATSLQRVATEGGVAPGGACAAGAETRVPYRATYLFYRAGR